MNILNFSSGNLNLSNEWLIVASVIVIVFMVISGIKLSISIPEGVKLDLKERLTCLTFGLALYCITMFFVELVLKSNNLSWADVNYWLKAFMAFPFFWGLWIASRMFCIANFSELKK
ncbi:hypothetical protein FXE80_00530 [Vibrio cholerae]|uniref:hypothetical protein n=1 Tax=Vibrio cholerae TaxID=666 RepID=UPI0011D7BFE9|nr:hypothetical protein [Vibrio cholerae]TXY77871.1 hypothetical protein FXE80_00530 [Vibrio cholerae]GIB16301.1 hypothetical protein VCSRO90_2686 [Vibrio cholerae]